MLAQRDVSAVYARLLLKSGLMPEHDLLAGSGLSAAELAAVDYISWEKMAALLRNLMAAQTSPAWAALMGAQFGISPHGALGYAALSAPTLGAALEVVAEYLAVRVSAIGIELERKDQRYILRLFDRGDSADVFNPGCEAALKTFESLIATILGDAHTSETAIYLARPQPEQDDDLQRTFDSKLQFAAGQNAISIPAKWWPYPSPLHDESSYRTNLAKCRELLSARLEQASFTHDVTAVLQQYFEQQINGQSDWQAPPGLKQVADNMHMTSRTLIRRLQAEDQTYKDILRNLRRDYARSLLGNARLSVAEVGECLGYREPANFGRAFRSWFGTSPAAWRRRQG